MIQEENMGVFLNRVIANAQKSKAERTPEEIRAQQARWGEEYDKLSHPDSFVRRLSNARCP